MFDGDPKSQIALWYEVNHNTCKQPQSTASEPQGHADSLSSYSHSTVCGCRINCQAHSTDWRVLLLYIHNSIFMDKSVHIMS